MIRWIVKRYYQYQLDKWTQAGRTFASALMLAYMLGDQDKICEFKSDLAMCKREIRYYEEKVQS